MANICHFLMKIAGKEANVQEFIRMLQWKDAYANAGLGRVYSFEVDTDTMEASPGDGKLCAIEGAGDCAWSFKTAIQDFQNRSLLEETNRLDLVIEAFSSEPGLEFQEHVLIDRGKLLLEECVDYSEFCVEGAEEFAIQEILDEKGLTREQLLAGVNHNGDYCEGGFDNFGAFQDLFPYLLSLQMQYEELTVYPYIGQYEENGNLYLGLLYFDEESKKVLPFTDVTVNLDDLGYLQSAVDTKSNGGKIVDFLCDNGFGDVTGTLFRSDGPYPIFRFHEKILNEIDPEAFSAYARAHHKTPHLQNLPLNDQIRTAEAQSPRDTQKFKTPPEPER